MKVPTGLKAGSSCQTNNQKGVINVGANVSVLLRLPL